MPVNPREIQRKPDHQRRALQRRLDAQMDKLKAFDKDIAVADEVLADWRENAADRLEGVCDIAFPMDAPKDPTSAAVLLGRIQGFLEPLRRAYDTLGITGQMKLNAEKIREAINDLGEEVYEDDGN